MQGKTLGQLAEYVSGKVVGDDEIMINAVSTLGEAGADEITFLSNKKYESQLKTTKAGAVITAGEIETDSALLIAEDPYYAFMQIVVLLHGHRKHEMVGISDGASVAKNAKLGSGCNVHNFATICNNARIGKNCNIYPGVFVGPDVEIGDDCIIYANAVIYDNCKIGRRVIIHANASIGQDGYGFATHKGIHHKIPQIGRVVLEDDVEIGSCCAVERGTLNDTVIGTGSKIGDSVAIGHGTKIGAHCLIVPQVGISGSVTLGHHCVLGGQVGIAGHLTIGNIVTVGAQAGVINSIGDGATVLGSPAIEAGKAKRVLASMQYIPDMRKSIRRIEKQIAKLESTEK